MSTHFDSYSILHAIRRAKQPISTPDLARQFGTTNTRITWTCQLWLNRGKITRPQKGNRHRPALWFAL